MLPGFTLKTCPRRIRQPAAQSPPRDSGGAAPYGVLQAQDTANCTSQIALRKLAPKLQRTGPRTLGSSLKTRLHRIQRPSELSQH